MNPLKWIDTALGMVGTIVTGVLARKQAVADAKADAKVKRIQAEVDWDNNQVIASEHSWKDEFHVLLLAAPVVLAFIPGMAPYVQAGFDVLSTLPEWFIAAFLTSVAASFGFKRLADLKK